MEDHADGTIQQPQLAQKRTSTSAKRLQLRQGRYVMVGRCNWTTLKHGLKSRLQILVHPPDQLEQPSRYRELVTTLQWVTAVLASRSGYLALGGKPEVHPEWEINEDDRVCYRQPSLNARPRPPAVHDPAFRCRHLVELPRHNAFVCLHPAGKPLDLINRDKRKAVSFSQTPSQGRWLLLGSGVVKLGPWHGAEDGWREGGNGSS